MSNQTYTQLEFDFIMFMSQNKITIPKKKERLLREEAINDTLLLKTSKKVQIQKQNVLKRQRYIQEQLLHYRD